MCRQSYHGAELIRPARSVRQLFCVLSGLLLYRVLEVRSCANNQALAMENRTANRLSVGFLVLI